MTAVIPVHQVLPKEQLTTDHLPHVHTTAVPLSPAAHQVLRSQAAARGRSPEAHHIAAAHHAVSPAEDADNIINIKLTTI